MADVSRCISNGWEAGPACSHAPCTHRRRYNRPTKDGAGGSSRPRLLTLQCATTNRLAYQATSQLEPGHQIKHLELGLIQPAEHIVLHPPADSLTHDTLHVLHQQQQQQHFQQEQQQQEHHLLVDVVEQLHSAPDINRLAAVIRRRSQQYGLAQEHVRAALLCMLKLVKGSHKDVTLRAEAHACLAVLCGCTVSASATHSNRPHTQLGAVSNWPVQDVVTLALVMVATSWHESSTWQQVVQCSWQHAAELYPHQAAQLLWATARLRGCGQEPSSEWLDILTERVRAGAGSLHTPTIAQAFHAIASLGHMPAFESMEDLLVRGVQQRLMEWSGGGLACVLWSLGTLKHHPGPQWMSDVLQHAEQHTYQFSTGTAAASMLWALAALGHAPPKPWMEQFLWQVQRRLKCCNAHALANIAWALAKLRYRPPNAWSAEFLRVAAQHMHAVPQLVQARQASSPPHSRQQSGGSSSTPVPLHRDEAMTDSSNRSTSSNGIVQRQLIVTLQSPQAASDTHDHHAVHTRLNGYAMQPPAAVQHASGSASTTGVAATGGGTNGVLGSQGAGASCQMQLHRPHRPTPCTQPQPLQDGVGQPIATPAVVSSHDADSMKQTVRGAGGYAVEHSRQIQAVTEQVLMQLWDARVAWKGSGAAPRSFTMFLWGIAQLQVLPRAPYLRRMLLAISPQLHAFRPRELACTLWGLQRLRFLPEPDMYAQLLAAVHVRLQAFDPQALLMTLTAISRYQPPYQIQMDLLYALCNQLSQFVPDLSASETATACTSLARIVSSGYKGSFPPSLHKSLLAQVQKQLPFMQMQELVNTAWACVQLARATGNNEHLVTGHAFLPYVARHMRRNMAKANHKDLIQLAVALSQVNYIPPKDWMSAHEAALRRMVKQGLVTRLELQPLITAYPVLGGDIDRLLALQAYAARAATAARIAATQSAAGVQQSSPALRVSREEHRYDSARRPTQLPLAPPVGGAGTGGAPQAVPLPQQQDGVPASSQLPHQSSVLISHNPQLTRHEQKVRKQLLTVEERVFNHHQLVDDEQTAFVQLQHSRASGANGFHGWSQDMSCQATAQATGPTAHVHGRDTGEEEQLDGAGATRLTWEHSAAGRKLKPPQGTSGVDGNADEAQASAAQAGDDVGARRMARLSRRQGQRQRLQMDILRS